MLVLLGAAVVLGSKVLDLLFGKPEPFEFTGSTTNPTNTDTAGAPAPEADRHRAA